MNDHLAGLPIIICMGIRFTGLNFIAVLLVFGSSWAISTRLYGIVEFIFILADPGLSSPASTRENQDDLTVRVGKTGAFRAQYFLPGRKRVKSYQALCLICLRYAGRVSTLACLMRGGAVWKLVGLITRRSQVQILPPLPIEQMAPSCDGYLQSVLT